MLVVGLAVAYFVVGRLTFAFDAQHGNITSVPFLPEGIALVAFIRYGPRVWPGVFLGQFVLAITTNISPEASAVVGAVNATEGALGGYLFHRLRISPDLARPRDVVGLVALIALVLQPLSATGGVFSQAALDGLDAAGRAWVYWWAGNTLGQLLVAAPLLVWTSGGRRPPPHELRQGLVVASAYAAVMLTFSIGNWTGSPEAIRLICIGGFLVAVTWVALHSEVATVAVCNLIAAMVLLIAANTKLDILEIFATSDRLLYAYLVVLGGVTSALIVAALIGQLRAQRDSLTRAQAKVFAVIGHDLRGPVHEVGLLLDVFTSADMDVEEARAIAADMRHEIDTTTGTLDRLMEWGRAEMDEDGAQPREVIALDTVARAVEHVRRRAAAKDVEVRNLVEPDVRIHADPAQAESIVRNLLNNAVKFTPRGGAVTVTAARQGLMWRLTVSDSGAGMDPAQIEHAVADATLASTPGTEGELGTGVGLWIVRAFAESNGGRLSIESDANAGTAAHVYLTASTGVRS